MSIDGIKALGLWLGPLVGLIMIGTAADQSVMSAIAWRVAGIALWMAIWWATEAIPVAATAFIPLVTFDLLGISTIKATAASYAHPTIYLFLGAFVLALAVEKWSLHRRIALWVILRAGTNPSRLIFGFMIAAAALSMWITNTSTAMMLLPIAASVAVLVAERADTASVSSKRDFQTALMLSLAYATTLGGMATLIGTPPNVFLAGFMEERYGVLIGFFDWLMIGLPLTLCLLPLGWWVLTKVVYRVATSDGQATQDALAEMQRSLGSLTVQERRVGVIFLAVVLLWMTRSYLDDLVVLQGLSDAGIAMTAALLLFIVPSGASNGGSLIQWEDLVKLPWSVLILFGGGLSLAAQVSSSGLAGWLGENLSPLVSTGLFFLVLAAAGLVVFLTELTSNLATTATFLPVIAAIATQSGIEPLVLCVPITLAASCAFMLPVATPPNAIVYASGMLTVPDMVRAGFFMNLIAMAILTVVAMFLVPAVFG